MPPTAAHLGSDEPQGGRFRAFRPKWQPLPRHGRAGTTPNRCQTYPIDGIVLQKGMQRTHLRWLLLSTSTFAMLVGILLGCSRDKNRPNTTVAQPLPRSSAAATPATTKKKMYLTSSAFRHGAEIPRAYTCQGHNDAPPLSFGDIPPNAKSLALILDDPDAPDPAAPQRTWVHWVIFNLPPNTREIVGNGAPLPEGAASGKNDWDRSGYGGPCPPIGRHRYFFHLYALDEVLDLELPTRRQLDAAMAGHIVGQAELMGTYKKH